MVASAGRRRSASAPGSAPAAFWSGPGFPAGVAPTTGSRPRSGRRAPPRRRSRAPGDAGVFDRGEARIETDAGELIESRSDPRSWFFGRAGLRRNLRWDALDAIYFAGYALWNYLNTPYLLASEEVRTRELEPWDVGEGRWRRLAADFRPGLDTHSPAQVFYFDEGGLLRRHDYVAEVVGGWARAAHMCAGHVEAGGLVFPTRRWVRPRGPGDRVLAGPTLVSLGISELEVG